jgi:Ca-activated chloride channel homolog
MTPFRAAALVVCATIGVLPQQAQQQAPFRSTAQTVEVYTTVTDAGGRLITDLPKEQFEVYDNGKLQTITTFTSDIQPITIVVLLDRSLSMLQNFGLVEKAAGAFVDRLLPADKARIGSFSNRIQLDPRDFTSDKGEMRTILQMELQDPGPTPLWNAVGVGMTALLHQQGRRVVLVFTDGMDNPMNMSPNNVTLKGVMKRSEEEDVMLYAIGLVGDPTGGFGGRGRRGGFGGGRGGWGGYGGRGRNQMDRPDPGLEKLSSASGGGYFELTSTDDLGSTFARVADELHHQYLLGFVPQVLDGKTHKLDVHLKTAGLSARARKSYVAAKDRP